MRSPDAWPELSVVLVGDAYATLREMAELLAAQSARDRMELILVLPAEAAERDVRPELDALGWVRSVEVGSIEPLGAARAAGVRAASAPVVFLAETHAFPEPACGEALIAAHRIDVAGVAPAIGNANPDTGRSWAAFLQDYGRLFDPPGGEVEALPVYNCSYKRERLLSLPGDLGELLEPTAELAGRLRATGARLAVEPAARIAHLNVSCWRPWAMERFLHGRIVAGARSRVWNRPRRALYAAAAPLVPLVLLVRIRPHLARARRRGVAPRRTLPTLALGVSISSLGELVGYVLGEGDAWSRMLSYELYKRRYGAGAG